MMTEEYGYTFGVESYSAKNQLRVTFAPYNLNMRLLTGADGSMDAEKWLEAQGLGH